MKKMRKIFILTLICTLILSTPITVSAKSKKIEKPVFVKPYTRIELKSDGSYKANVPLMTICSGAKKIEFYRATTEKGKYKKVATGNAKAGAIKNIKATQGLSFYKGRGINGKKKGSFNSPVPMYCTNTIIKDYKVNTDENTVDIKLLVDNRKSNKSMTFVNSEFSTLYVSFNRDEKLKAPIESKYSDFYALYDVNYTYLTGHLVDQDGNDVKTTTIGSKKKGYVYLKYKPTTDEYATLPEDIQLGLAEIVLDKYFSDDCKETYIWITQQFKVKSGSKTYKFGIDTGKDFASFYRM